MRSFARKSRRDAGGYGYAAERDHAKVAQRHGADTTVPEWRERLVCSACGSHNVDMVVTGIERR
jgi:hypothetical protein